MVEREGIVAVTGAAGFIGSHVVRRLAHAGARPIALLRPGADAWRIADVRDRIRIVEWRPDDAKALSELVERERVRTLFAIGWSGVTDHRASDLESARANLAMVFAVADAAARGLRAVVGVGSQAEYGPRDHVVGESEALAPVSLYGATKAAAGLIAGRAAAQHGVAFSWLRLFGTYGPADNARWLIPGTILELMRGRSPRLTAGDQSVDYLYVDDVVEGLLAASATADGVGFCNLSSGEGLTVREIAERLRDLVDPKLELGFGELIASRPKLTAGDGTKLRSLTGWSPRTAIDEGLRRTVAWFRENGDRYRPVPEVRSTP